MKNTTVKPESTFKVYELISGYWVACGIHVVARLGIADLLLDKPLTISELSERSKTDAPSLYRLLRAVASVGIFEEQEDGRFSINDLGTALLTGVSGSVKAWALANLGEHFPAFGNLTYGIQTGKIPFDDVHGVSLWDYYKQHPDAGKNVIEALAGVSGAVIQEITSSYDFSPYSKIVDLGGGNGALMFGVLNSSLKSKGIVFDEPYVIEQTEKSIPADLKDRCSVSGGSFFEEVPAGADLYMTKWVLHDWNDEEVVDILKVTERAMGPGSKLLIIEAVIPDEINVPHASKLLDLNVFAMSPGKERTESEFKGLLEKAGLKHIRTILSKTDLAIMIEAEKIA